MIRLYLELQTTFLLLFLVAPARVLASTGWVGPCAVLSVSSQSISGHSFVSGTCRNEVDADHFFISDRAIKLGDVLKYIPCPIGEIYEPASCFITVIDSPDISKEVSLEDAER